MRLHKFQAATLRHALDKARHALGEECFVVATDQVSNGIEITVALEEEEQATLPSKTGALTSAAPLTPLNLFCQCLEDHHLPQAVIEHLISKVIEVDDTFLQGDLQTMVAALFKFSNLTTLSKGQPIMMLGVAGAGKSLVAAKLAAQFVAQEQPVEIISLERSKAGGRAQMDTFCKALQIPHRIIESPILLKAYLQNHAPKKQIIIDGSSLHPYCIDDLQKWYTTITALKPRTYLVAAAGQDPHEAVHITNILRPFSLKGMVITKLDMAQHLGSILTLATMLELPIYATNSSGLLHQPLAPMGPSHLTQMLQERHKNIHNPQFWAQFDRLFNIHDLQEVGT